MTTLVTRYLLGTISKEEEEELRQWLDASFENREFFGKICSSAGFEAYYNEFKQIDSAAAYRQFLIKTRKPTVFQRLKPLYKYAAAILLMVIVAASAWYFAGTERNGISAIKPGGTYATLILDDGSQIALVTDSLRQIQVGNSSFATNTEEGIDYSRQDAAVSSEIKYNTLVAPRGGEYRLTLADGTKIHLNSASELRYPVNFKPAAPREVFLKGEAYFEVAKDLLQAFYVNVGDISVKQYGTQFNINAYPENPIQVVLVEGSIGILTDNPSSETQINILQLAEYNTENKSLTVKTVDIAPFIAWNKGIFTFEDKKLGDIMNTLSLWYDMDVVFEREDLKNIRFTGSVERSVPVENIFDAIQFSTEVSIAVKGNKVFINKSRL
jgi:ferric-dicitrate binding protein FerR (iron transport regulator)